MSNSIINFENLFNSLDNCDYSIIKLDHEFPNYKFGQDLDIFCRDVEEISRIIISFLAPLVSSNIKINVNKSLNQIYIDLIEDNKIHFRFDLYGGLPNFKTINIKPSLFDVIIESSEKKQIKNFIIKTPNEIDETVIRYIEYLEYISLRPDKIKHIEYILNNLSQNEHKMQRFIDRTHQFISMVPINSEMSKKSHQYYEVFKYCFNLITRLFNSIKNNGVRKTISKVYIKLFGN